MPYAALPTALRLPYHFDSTAVAAWIGSQSNVPESPPSTAWADEAKKADMNDGSATFILSYGANVGAGSRVLMFLPHPWRITHMVWLMTTLVSNVGMNFQIQGSNDSTNGTDGTWETASFPSGSPIVKNGDGRAWRSGIVPVTFTQAFRVYRMVQWSGNASSTNNSWAGVHLYGTKAEAHDLVFVDVDADPDADFVSDIDFGDVLASDTRARTFAIRNTSASRTATAVTLSPPPGFMLSLASTGPWDTAVNYSTPAQGASVSTPSGEHAGNTVDRTIDGDDTTYWNSTASAASAVLDVDLGIARRINAIRLYQGAGSPTAESVSALNLQTSPDGVTWTTARTLSGLVAGDQTVAFEYVDARYFRLAATAGGGYGWCVRTVELRGLGGQTLDIGSIGPGATSAPVYMRGFTSALIGPWAEPIQLVCDIGFFD